MAKVDVVAVTSISNPLPLPPANVKFSLPAYPVPVLAYSKTVIAPVPSTALTIKAAPVPAPELVA